MTVFKINNIAIKIHLLLVVVFSAYVFMDYSLEAIIIAITVLFHETAHVVLSLRMGFKVEEIELFPFGGVARLSNMIEVDPKDEIIISLAGPIANGCFATIAYILKLSGFDYYILDFVIKINIYMGIFNITPLFPLDGGRIARAFLSYILGVKYATRVLTYLTYGCCIGASIFSIINLILGLEGIHLITIALFLMIAANKEKKVAAFVFMKDFMSKKEQLIKKGVMKIHLVVCLKDVKAYEALNSFLPRRYHIVIVIDKRGKWIGKISENELLDRVVELGVSETLENLLKTQKKC